MVHTDYLWFNTTQRQEFVRITDAVARIVVDSDFQEWLEKLAPAGLPYAHHQTGEDNGDAHLKRTLMGHQVIVPITAGRLDLGPWEQVFYAEFDGKRRKRVVIKVMGE